MNFFKHPQFPGFWGIVRNYLLRLVARQPGEHVINLWIRIFSQKSDFIFELSSELQCNGIIYFNILTENHNSSPEWMLAMQVSANHRYVETLNVSCLTYGLVRFRHKSHLVKFRKRSCFGLKYLETHWNTVLNSGLRLGLKHHHHPSIPSTYRLNYMYYQCDMMHIVNMICMTHKNLNVVCRNCGLLITIVTRQCVIFSKSKIY